ncbi:MAG TPA: DUF3343 domain-containing protein [Syntrophorhabdaceae bacterium]|nr:DUF3343 domain-containing protein [Syntrophorhabdaceae bacterium]
MNTNNPEPQYLVALFESVSGMFAADLVLKEAQVPHKVIPVPRKISTDCGFCIRFLPEHGELLTRALNGKAETYIVRTL